MTFRSNVTERLTQEEKQRAFLDAFLPIHVRLERYVRSMTRDTDEARDIVGDTVLAAFEGYEKLISPGAFLSFVFTIARRTLSRQRLRARFFTIGDDETMSLAIASTLPPDSAAEARIVHDALRRLSLKEREALVLHELSDLPLIEVATIQGVTLPAIKQRVSRARKKLAALLREVTLDASLEQRQAAPEIIGTSHRGAED